MLISELLGGKLCTLFSILNFRLCNQLSFLPKVLNYFLLFVYYLFALSAQMELKTHTSQKKL